MAGEWWKYALVVSGGIILGMAVGVRTVDSVIAKRLCSATGMSDLQTLVTSCPNVSGYDIDKWTVG